MAFYMSSRLFNHLLRLPIAFFRKDIPANELSRSQQRIHTIDTVSVQKNSVYHWEVQLTNHQAEVANAFLEIRRNHESWMFRFDFECLLLDEGPSE